MSYVDIQNKLPVAPPKVLFIIKKIQNNGILLTRTFSSLEMWETLNLKSLIKM